MKKIFNNIKLDISYYFKISFFSFREQVSDFSSVLGWMLLYPFFVWLLAQIWLRFAPANSSFSYSDLVIYIGITELIIMSHMRMPIIKYASNQFALSLSRPRSWLLTQGVEILGRGTGYRTAFFGLFGVLIPCLTQSTEIFSTIPRIFLMMPIFSIADMLWSLLLANAILIWPRSTYFRLPISKLFLVLGGVFAPICDWTGFYQKFALSLPFSDLIFQPAFFILKGKFWNMSGLEWCFRISIQFIILLLINYYGHKIAKKYFQAWGG
jgi:hypothetical protein